MQKSGINVSEVRRPVPRAQKRTLIALVAVAGLTAACHKKVAIAPPPTPPAVTQSSNAKSAQTSVRTPTNESRASAATATPRYPDKATRARIDELLAKIEDAYFDYNKASLRPDALKTLASDSAELRDILKDYPDYKLKIEGYCDERGSDEYNMALGDRRAEAAKDYLVQVGIPNSQLSVVSYGKQKPVCTEHDEACWQRNRRIHFVAMAENR
jgi:peptidoglycan-associated lipoprotein